jgi:hypothetical protein
MPNKPVKSVGSSKLTAARCLARSAAILCVLANISFAAAIARASETPPAPFGLVRLASSNAAKSNAFSSFDLRGLRGAFSFTGSAGIGFTGSGCGAATGFGIYISLLGAVGSFNGSRNGIDCIGNGAAGVFSVIILIGTLLAAGFGAARLGPDLPKLIFTICVCFCACPLPFGDCVRFIGFFSFFGFLSFFGGII